VLCFWSEQPKHTSAMLRFKHLPTLSLFSSVRLFSSRSLTPPPYTVSLTDIDLTPTVQSIISTCANVFTSNEPSKKVQHLVHLNSSTGSSNSVEPPLNQSESTSELLDVISRMNHPARPATPTLSDIRDIPSLKESGLSQPIYMLHNCAHIELNAIDVCCHTLLLPSLHHCQPQQQSLSISDETMSNSAKLSLPEEFYQDFVSIARDEARHFQMLSDRLIELGSYYGVLNSHKMLWDGAARTSHSLLARIVMCQLINECRGLDSGPRLVHKLKSSGDNKSAQIMQQIVDEEENHVRLGMKWFLRLCEQMNLEPKETFQSIVNHYYGKLVPPFNHEARNRAEMPREWYESLSRER